MMMRLDPLLGSSQHLLSAMEERRKGRYGSERIRVKEGGGVREGGREEMKDITEQ